MAIFVMVVMMSMATMVTTSSVSAARDMEADVHGMRLMACVRGNYKLNIQRLTVLLKLTFYILV